MRGICSVVLDEGLWKLGTRNVNTELAEVYRSQERETNEDHG